MSESQPFDITIENGLFFDGRGGDPLPRHLGIRDGRIAEISEDPIPPSRSCGSSTPETGG